jgi:hypothetical protein
MNKKQVHIHLIVLVLIAVVLFCLRSLHQHPSNKLIQTTRLIEKSLPKVEPFYTDQFIFQVRSAMRNAVILNNPTDSAVLLAIQQAQANKIFIAGLAHITQHKAGWPTVEDNLNRSITIKFTIQAPRNFVISLSCIESNHLIFDAATGLDGVFALEMESWKGMITTASSKSN